MLSKGLTGVLGRQPMPKAQPDVSPGEGAVCDCRVPCMQFGLQHALAALLRVVFGRTINSDRPVCCIQTYMPLSCMHVG
jgi:hypothetical protein